MAEIRTTLYSRELEKMLYPDNSFVQKSIVERGVADSAVAVEKPVETSQGKAKEGKPNTLPLQIRSVTDDKKSYPLTYIYHDPILVTEDSQILTNYNKRQAKQQQQANEMNTKIAAYTVQHWSPTLTSNILKTTGENRASNVIGMSSQRKAVTKADMVRVQNLMMRMMMGRGGRWYGMVTPDMYSDLLLIPEFVDYEKLGTESKLKEGIIGRILGIDIFVRSTEEGHSGILYNGNTPLSGDAEVKDELLTGALFWNSNAVCRAEGILHTNVSNNAPGYLGGTIIESWTRYGADIIRSDQKGVIALLEAK